MITSIQIHENVKKELEKLKENKESYEEVIIKMMKKTEEEWRKEESLIIKGYKELGKICKSQNFEDIEEDFDWEW